MGVRDRRVSESLRHQVPPTASTTAHFRYELDHLIPWELGGNNSARNLWPETLTDDDKVGPSKDTLENHLHALVCHHQGLATAQHAIATNWLSGVEPVRACGCPRRFIVERVIRERFVWKRIFRRLWRIVEP